MTGHLKRRVGAGAITLFGLLLLVRSQFAPSEVPPEVVWSWAWSFAVAGIVLCVMGLWLWMRVAKVPSLRPRQVLIIVLSSYLAAFLTPAIDDGNQQTGFPRGGFSATETAYGRHWNRVLQGWEVFLSVPAKLPFSIAFLPAWLANPVLWAALVSLKKGRLPKARRAAIVCSVLALSTALALPGTRHWLTPLGGYYLWIGVMVICWLAASMCQTNELQREATAAS